MRTPKQPGSPPDEEDNSADGGRARQRVKQFEQQRGLPPGKGSNPAPAPTPPPSPAKKR